TRSWPQPNEREDPAAADEAPQHDRGRKGQFRDPPEHRRKVGQADKLPILDAATAENLVLKGLLGIWRIDPAGDRQFRARVEIGKIRTARRRPIPMLAHHDGTEGFRAAPQRGFWEQSLLSTYERPAAGTSSLWSWLGRLPPAQSALYTSLVLLIGNSRMRFPVAAKIALQIAGAIGGTPGSPTPAGSAPFCTRVTCTSRGASLIRATG